MEFGAFPFKNIQGTGWCGSVVECRPAKQKVAGSVPSDGTCLCRRPGLWLGVCESQRVEVSLTHP